MQECDKRNSHISSKISINLLIMIDTLLLRPSRNFTTLHPTTLHSTSLHLSTTSSHLNFLQLHFTTLHYPLIWFNPIQISYRSTSPHITPLHLTLLPCTFRRFSPHFYSFPFTPFIIVFLNLFLKILGLQGKVPNDSEGS